MYILGLQNIQTFIITMQGCFHFFIMIDVQKHVKRAVDNHATRSRK